MNCNQPFTTIAICSRWLLPFLVLCEGPGFQARAAGQDEPIKVTATGSLVRIPDGDDYRCDLDVGTLPSSSRILAALSISNPGDTDLHVSPEVSLCNCISFRISSTVIPAKGETICTLEFRTPDRLTRDSFSMPINIAAGTTPDGSVDSIAAGVNLSVNFRLSGLMNLLDLNEVVEIPKGVPVINADFPLLITEPVRAADIMVSTSSTLRDVVGQIAEVEGGFVLRVACSAEAVSDGPISGQVDLHDPVSGRRSSMRLTIRPALKFMIAPNVLTFSKQPDRADQDANAVPWRSNAVLRIKPVDRSPVDQQPDDEPAKPSVSVDCWIGESKVQTSVAPIGKSTSSFRITLEVAGEPETSEVQPDNKRSDSVMLKMLLKIDGELEEREFPVVFLR